MGGDTVKTKRRRKRPPADSGKARGKKIKDVSLRWRNRNYQNSTKALFNRKTGDGRKPGKTESKQNWEGDIESKKNKK